MRIGSLGVLLLCVVSPLAAQGPRVTRWDDAAAAPVAAPQVPLAALGLAEPADSVAHRGTYWLRGALIGTAVMGLVGSQFCGEGTSSKRLSCYVPAFAFVGGVAGFPIGALIGSLFHKS